MLSLSVPCPEGTFFDSSTKVCNPCPIGMYNKEIGQMECQACPEFQGKQGVTETLTATSVDECKGEKSLLGVGRRIVTYGLDFFKFI